MPRLQFLSSEYTSQGRVSYLLLRIPQYVFFVDKNGILYEKNGIIWEYLHHATPQMIEADKNLQ